MDARLRLHEPSVAFKPAQEGRSEKARQSCAAGYDITGAWSRLFLERLQHPLPSIIFLQVP